MGTKAYFMINVAEEFYRDYYQDVVRELKAIPEVESIERISGSCDLLVKVDSPLSRLIFVANKILAKEWVKKLNVLHVEPIQPDEYQGLSIEEMTRIKRVVPAETA